MTLSLPDTHALTAAELRRLNRQLAAHGLKICGKHRGDPLPLDEAHFYRRSDGSFYGECKQCHGRRNAAAMTRRYRTDADYADRRRTEARQRYARHQDERLAYAADYRQQHHEAIVERGRRYYRDVVVARRHLDGILPIPPGLCAVVYDTRHERLRRWGGTGTLTASEPCSVDEWTRREALYRRLGYLPVAGWGERYVVLAAFAGVGTGESEEGEVGA